MAIHWRGIQVQQGMLKHFMHGQRQELACAGYLGVVLTAHWQTQRPAAPRKGR